MYNKLYKSYSKEIAENVEKNNKLLAKLKRLNKGE
jgi:flagellar hook-associated protein FlgK